MMEEQEVFPIYYRLITKPHAKLRGNRFEKDIQSCWHVECGCKMLDASLFWVECTVMDNVKRMRLDFPCLQTTVFIEDTVSIAKNLYIPSDLESVCIVVHLEKKRLLDNQCVWFATIIFIMGVSKKTSDGCLHNKVPSTNFFTILACVLLSMMCFLRR